MKRKRDVYDARFNSEVIKEIEKVVGQGYSTNKATLLVLKKYTGLQNVQVVDEVPDLFREFKSDHFRCKAPDYYMGRFLVELCQADVGLAKQFLTFQEKKGVVRMPFTLKEFRKWPHVEGWLSTLNLEKKALTEHVLETLEKELWNEAFIDGCSEFQCIRKSNIQNHLFYVSALATLDAFPNLFTVKEWHCQPALSTESWSIVPEAKRWKLCVNGELWTLLPKAMHRNGGQYYAMGVVERNGPTIAYGPLQSHPWATYMKLWNTIQTLLSKIFPGPLVPICISYTHSLGAHSLIPHYY